MTAGIIELLERDPQGSVLLDAVLDAPNEYLSSQAFADWLEENGVPGVELIRSSFTEEVCPSDQILTAWLGDAIPDRAKLTVKKFILHHGVLRALVKGSQEWSSFPPLLQRGLRSRWVGALLQPQPQEFRQMSQGWQDAPEECWVEVAFVGVGLPFDAIANL